MRYFKSLKFALSGALHKRNRVLKIEREPVFLGSFGVEKSIDHLVVTGREAFVKKPEHLQNLFKPEDKLLLVSSAGSGARNFIEAYRYLLKQWTIQFKPNGFAGVVMYSANSTIINFCRDFPGVKMFDVPVEVKLANHLIGQVPQNLRVPLQLIVFTFDSRDGTKRVLKKPPRRK